MFNFTTPRSVTLFRLAAAAGLVTVAAPAFAFVGSASAAAADEPVPNPAAAFEFDCGPDGGTLDVTLTNPSGPYDVAFNVWVDDGGAPKSATVAPDAVAHLAWSGLHDNQSYVVNVAAAGGYTTAATSDPLNCVDFHGVIETYCLGDQAMLRAQADQYMYPSTVYFDFNGLTESAFVSDTHTFSTHLVDGEQFSAGLRTDEDGEFAHLEGSLDCSTPDTIPTTVPTVTPETIPATVPETVPAEVPETTAPTTDHTPETGPEMAPANTTPAPLVAAPAPDAHAVAPTTALATELPATGASTGIIGVSAAIILVVGTCLRRLASRAAKSTR